MLYNYLFNSLFQYIRINTYSAIDTATLNQISMGNRTVAILLLLPCYFIITWMSLQAAVGFSDDFLPLENYEMSSKPLNNHEPSNRQLDSKFPSPSSPLSINLLCLGMACDVIKCHEDSDCPPFHKCDGHSSSRLSTAGGILGSPLSSLDLPINPLRSSGGLLSVGPSLFQGALDGLWDASIPRMARPLGELRNTKYCVASGWTSSNTLSVPRNYQTFRPPTTDPLLQAGTSVRFTEQPHLNTPASFHNVLETSYEDPDSFSISFGPLKGIETAKQEELEEESTIIHPVIQQSGKYITFKPVVDPKGKVFVEPAPVYEKGEHSERSNNVEPGIANIKIATLQESTEIVEKSEFAEIGTSVNGKTFLVIPSLEKDPMYSASFGSIVENPAIFEGQTSTALNVINSIFDVQIQCRNPTFTAVVGGSFTLNLTNSSPSTSIIQTDLFNIILANNVNNTSPPFVFVKDIQSLRNLASTVTVQCSAEGRFPIPFKVLVSFGFEISAGIQVCMAEAICNAPPIVTPAVTATTTVRSSDSIREGAHRAVIANPHTPDDYHLYFEKHDSSVVIPEAMQHTIKCTNQQLFTEIDDTLHFKLAELFVFSNQNSRGKVNQHDSGAYYAAYRDSSNDNTIGEQSNIFHLQVNKDGDTEAQYECKQNGIFIEKFLVTSFNKDNTPETKVCPITIALKITDNDYKD
ncbi:hypothetical protein IE077_000884 [Cardiosporidium cionae]|uniref:Uncharacterized protein n=1 Tax=Cardiosporidium cionae TaxID=476202 RepID=A0ABQ7J6C6_9APIC|nr:hypothetical protein IE077_000884 [Cardiosporidium cionae]|eukprot:KAF8819533.1 hypothetical protein IE077_000884 [Cardiosporidium cionae]